MEENDVLDTNEAANNDAEPGLTKAEHLRRIKEASNKFLNVSGKLERVCPLNSHSGYALYECGVVCDYCAETGLLPGNKKNSKNVMFSAAYSTSPVVMSNNTTKKGSPNPDPEAWKVYYESRSFERKKVLDYD